MQNSNKTNAVCDIIVSGIITLFVLLLSIICFKRYYCFDYFDMDLAAYNQIVWNIVHGSFFSSILGVNFLGHHAHFILLLIAPVYYFFQSPLTLVFLQIFSLGIAAYPIYLIAKKELDMPLAIGLVLAYFLYPAMVYTALYEFHVTAFATAFLSFMFYFYIMKRFRMFVVFMVLSLLCQENLPLVIFPFGIFAWFEKRSLKWFLTPLLSSAVWFLIVVGKIMPMLNADTVQFSSIYSHMGDSLPQVAFFMISHPIAVLKIILTPEKLEYLFKLFSPLCFFSLFDHRILIAGLLFLQHLLSSRSPEYLIEYHYDAELLPFIFISAIYAIKRFTNFKIVKKHLNSKLLVFLLVAVSLTCASDFGPFIELAVDKNKTNRDIWDYQKQRFIQMIGPKESVVATFELLPMLSNRAEVYSFHHVIHGFYTLSRKPYVLPAGVEYALLDVYDPISMNSFYIRNQSEVNMANFLSAGKWGVVDYLGNIVLLKKNHVSGSRLYSVLEDQEEPLLSDKAGLRVGDDFVFLGFNRKSESVLGSEKVIDLEFFYKPLQKIKADYIMEIELIDAKDQVLYTSLRPLCYRMLPSYLWPESGTVQDSYRLLVPQQVVNERFKIGFRFYPRNQDKQEDIEQIQFLMN
jgi:uncharacterized membrane protein